MRNRGHARPELGGGGPEGPREGERAMLVLTRKLMERLYIGGDICVTVVRLEGGQVRLGIDAPKHVPVVRAELLPRGDGSSLPPHREASGQPPDPSASSPSSASQEFTNPPSWARGSDSRPRGPSR